MNNTNNTNIEIGEIYRCINEIWSKDNILCFNEGHIYTCEIKNNLMGEDNIFHSFIEEYFYKHFIKVYNSKSKNKFKLFACTRSSCYSGGLIIVCANNLQEAFNIAKEELENKHLSYLITEYPISAWYEIKDCTVNANKPMLIAEDGYTE